jgi:thiol-disulfide isomerase/thioredoxin
MKVLKFGATWCPGCLIMKPRWDEIEQENPWLETEFLDADQATELVNKYAIKDLPTFVYLDQAGNEIERQHGIIPKTKIVETINQYKDK